MRVLLLFIFASLISCSIARKTDVKFKEENANSIISYLDAKKVSNYSNDVATFNGINTFIEYNNSDKLSVPEAYFFNKEGYRVKDNFNGTNCGQVIGNIDQINNAPCDRKEHINDWIAKYNFPLKTNTDIASDNEQYDAYIIITWAIFSDRFNETSFKWYKDIKEYKDLKIKTILLDIDVIDSWTLNDKQKETLGLK